MPTGSLSTHVNQVKIMKKIFTYRLFDNTISILSVLTWHNKIVFEPTYDVLNYRVLTDYFSVYERIFKAKIRQFKINYSPY